MGDEKFNYKGSELNEDDNMKRINNLCNEYGCNLGNSRKCNNDIFDHALRLKHYNNEHN